MDGETVLARKKLSSAQTSRKIILETRSTSVAAMRPSVAKCRLAARQTTTLSRREIAWIGTNRLSRADAAVNICRGDPRGF